MDTDSVVGPEIFYNKGKSGDKASMCNNRLGGQIKKSGVQTEVYLAKVLLWSFWINTGVPACTGLDPSFGSV